MSNLNLIEIVDIDDVRIIINTDKILAIKKNIKHNLRDNIVCNIIVLEGKMCICTKEDISDILRKIHPDCGYRSTARGVTE